MIDECIILVELDLIHLMQLVVLTQKQVFFKKTSIDELKCSR
jgi:hypothetical protein